MFHFANIFNSKFQNNYCFVQKLPLSINKKSAKPALCTPRIAKAILVDAPLLYEHFPIP